MGQSASRGWPQIVKAETKATIVRVARGKASRELKDRFEFLTGDLRRPYYQKPSEIAICAQRYKKNDRA